MADDRFLGDFHKSTSGKHPTNSLGNMQIWVDDIQVGALEFIPNLRTRSLDIELSTPDDLSDMQNTIRGYHRRGVY